MYNSKLNTILYGSDSAIPEPLPLKAGPFDLILQDGMIRQIGFNNIPVCNRVYFALRDRYWNTVPGSFVNNHQSINSNSFDLTFKGMYSHDDINLESSFDLHGNTSGEITFSFKAVACTSFYRNRIGFCTLLPVDQCKGKQYRVLQSDSKVTDCTFPEMIAPWQPNLDIKSITYPVSDFTNVTISFDGDLFEMEDQRNWTDYSYKIYSTRLSDTLPVFIDKGTTIEQTVTFTVSSKSNTMHSPCQKNKNTPIPLNVASDTPRKVPQIGTCLDYAQPHSVDIDDICRFAYIRLDIHFDHPDHSDVFSSIISLCKQQSITPEFVLFCTLNITEELTLFADTITASGIKPVRIIVHKQNENIISDSTITAAKAMLCEAFPDTPLLFGTDRYFVELNRNRNSIDLCEQFCYSLNPQVHTFDNESIMENLPGIDATIQTAQSIFGNKKVHITPITLRPRINRSNPFKSGGPDMRLYGLFGAAWTAGALFYSINDNVDSLCFFELNGDHGIFDNTRKTVAPAYHLLSKIAPFSGGFFSMMTPGNQKSVVAFYLQKKNRSLQVIANLTNTIQTMEITNQISGKAQVIDTTSYEQLCTNYKKWEKQSQQVTYTNAVILSEYAVILIEQEL